MSMTITTCEKCDSTDIKELNPEVRNTTQEVFCKINCVCNSCGHKFIETSWTEYGQRHGIWY